MECEYRQWSAQLQRYLLARIGDPELAEEIVQEALFRLLCKRSQGKEIKNPRAWLFQTVRNLAVDVVRANLPMSLGLEAMATLPDPSSIPQSEEVVHTRVGEQGRQELLELIPDVMSKLSQEDRETLNARYRYGVSCRKMAALAGISLGNAKVRLYRARKRVKSVLENQLEGGSEA